MGLFDKTENKKQGRGSSPKQLLFALDTNVKMLVNEVTVTGKEHLREIPLDRKVVITATHMSDLDVPLVGAALARDFNLAISDVSTHHSLLEDPLNKFAITVAGQKNFLPIDYKTAAEGHAAKFNPDNFANMEQEMQKGKDILVAAHNPSHTGDLAQGGIGAIYLAQLSGALILPVAANTFSGETFMSGKTLFKTALNKPNAEVSIGAPIELDPIPGIEDYKNIFDKRKNGEKLTDEEFERFKEISRALRSQSDMVMKILAEMVPEEKRGPYKNEA